MEGEEEMVASDGYHTFDELYDHRITLFIALCRQLSNSSYHDNDNCPIWRSKVHSDGSVWDGWFILGIGKEKGRQITYHLPLDRWQDAYFARIEEKAPEWDGHTPQDVLDRLKDL